MLRVGGSAAALLFHTLKNIHIYQFAAAVTCGHDTRQQHGDVLGHQRPIEQRRRRVCLRLNEVCRTGCSRVGTANQTHTHAHGIIPQAVMTPHLTLC